MCSVDAYYSPNSCNLIENWTLVSFDSATQQEEQHQIHPVQEIVSEHQDDPIRSNVNEAELLVSESKSSMAKQQSNKLLEINKK